MAQRKPGKSRFSPVRARCGERHSILDQSFVDHAAKVPEEPNLTDAALRQDDR